MIRSTKKRPAKHLEKMLFINHKEDMLLQDRLADLTLMSKLKIMDLDRERIKVRTELRNSRKKNIDVKDAAVLSVSAANTSASPLKHNDTEMQRHSVGKTSNRKHSLSAPPGGRLAMISEAPVNTAPSGGQSVNTETSSNMDSPPGNLRRKRRISVNQFARETSLPEINESLIEDEDEIVDIIPLKEMPKRETETNRYRSNSVIDESVGAYVLGEFRRISQVVPSILLALSRKDEEEEDDNFYQPDEENSTQSLLDYEPDLHKVTKTVSTVKKLRHRMSINKKLEVCRPTKTLEQMIKEKTESTGTQNEYTDGTCVLMKRRLEKKRRNSAIPGLSQPSFMLRRQSLFAQPDALTAVKTNPSGTFGMPDFQRQRNRSQSVYSVPKLSRSHSMIGFGSSSLRQDNEFKSPVIDEDEFINRQRILRELENFAKINVKVDQFLATNKSRQTRYQDIDAIN